MLASYDCDGSDDYKVEHLISFIGGSGRLSDFAGPFRTRSTNIASYASFDIGACNSLMIVIGYGMEQQYIQHVLEECIMMTSYVVL